MSRGIAPQPIFFLLLLFAQTAAADWVEHASIPGSGIAEFGESRFDQLFRRDGSYHLPYPFDALIEHLEERIDNGAHSGVRQVFVPKGRSLQRDTAAPDYFRYPRRVIALEGEPRMAAAEFERVLEYRLFIAHQPATETLEVISYNDRAGRFEFQVVDNYRSGGEMRVRSANRAMCLSCHQNAAPIFARSPWSETSFNVEVSKRLVEALPQKFDSLIDVVTLDAGVIDVLTERANYLAAAQSIWRRGCSSVRCRAAMLRAVLQYRLSARSSFDWHSEKFRNDYYSEIVGNFRRNWPHGLRLASSRIPDRNPLQDPVAGEFDPLQLRPPHATWHEADPVFARGIIYRLAGFLTAADVRRLDRHLIDTATPERRLYRAGCSPPSSAGEFQLLICGGQQKQLPYAEIHIDQNGKPLRVARLRIPGDVNLIQPDLFAVARAGSELKLELGHVADDLSLRLADGNRITALRLQRNPANSALPYRLQIEVADDFERVELAIARLAQRQDSGSASGLDDSPFQRALIMPALMHELGMNANAWPAAAEIPNTAEPAKMNSPSGRLALLGVYCAHCHNDEGAHPPAFLNPTDETRLIRCAPRMLARIETWRQPAPSRPAPMPPPASIGLSGASAETWPQSAQFAQLIEAVESLIDGGQDWRDRDYSLLPPCL